MLTARIKNISKAQKVIGVVALLVLCVGLVSGVYVMRASPDSEIIGNPGDVVVTGVAPEINITQTKIYEETVVTEDMPQAVQVSIDNPDAPFDVVFEEDKAKNILHAKGRGLKEFTEIKIVHGEHTALTKTDWAGGFNIRLPMHLVDPDKPITFAFGGYQDVVEHDGNTFAPLETHVFWAPGGGGPDSDDVNDYENPFCGDPPLSVCVTSRMDAQIEAVVENYDRSLLMMGEQLSVVMMQYVQMIGSFIDAKSQMDTQRTHQRLKAEAVKDYHPSEQMCRFGSYIKSVSDVNQNMALTKQALNKSLMEAYTGVEENSTSESVGNNFKSRLKQFTEVYCDPRDNNSGLGGMCGGGAADKNRVNKDIDFGRTMNFPMTLDVDYSSGSAPTADEEDVLALAMNLYWPTAMNHAHEKGIARDPVRYMNLRTLFALNNVAHNSFTNYAAMKASGPKDMTDGGGRYMKAMLREFGIADDKIEELMGEYPSYNAQMEFLTKKIYQNPHFYTNLYDKPANVKRIGVTLDALKLMQMRDMHEASMRREMLTSAMIEEALTDHVNKINTAIDREMGRRQAKSN